MFTNWSRKHWWTSRQAGRQQNVFGSWLPVKASISNNRTVCLFNWPYWFTHACLDNCQPGSIDYRLARHITQRYITAHTACGKYRYQHCTGSAPQMAANIRWAVAGAIRSCNGLLDWKLLELLRDSRPLDLSELCSPQRYEVFPKPFCCQTSMGNDSYPLYCRQFTSEWVSE